MNKLAWRNLFRNKRRSILTMGSVAITIILLCLLAAVLTAMESAEGTSDNRIVVRNAISLTFDLPEAYEQKLRGLDHVQEVTPLTWFGGTYIDTRPQNFFAQFGTDPETMPAVFPDYLVTEGSLEDWRAERTAFLSGKALADKYGWSIGDNIVLKGAIYPVDLELTLRGIYTVAEARSQEQNIFFHRKYLEESLGNPGSNGTYWLKIDAPDNGAAVIGAAEAMFENSEAQVRAETEKAFQLSFLEMMGNVRLFLGAIGLAVIVSLLFITANTMAMAARERTGEVAVLKTLGFPRSQVMGMVLAESLAVGIAGTVVGLVLATLIIKGAASGLQEVFPVFGTLAVTPRIAALALVLGIVIGILSGWFPAMQAARMRVVDGLRRVA